MELADQVKLKRQELEMSQDELARRMGYKSRSSINKIEMGRPVSQKIIVKLAESLNITPAYLMGWEDDESEKKKKKKVFLILLHMMDLVMIQPFRFKIRLKRFI